MQIIAAADVAQGRGRVVDRRAFDLAHAASDARNQRVLPGGRIPG
ncbi:hypothetical protein [Lewinella sp. IMCC34191]|nr:hypothetical protein [Lewinella sp. IMCC34191]